MDSRSVDLQELNAFFFSQKDLLLRLLENPSMIEHETFVPLLLAVFHLSDELNAREKLTDLSSTDYNHLMAFSSLNGLIICII